MPISKRLVPAAVALLTAAGTGRAAEETPSPGRLGRDVIPAMETLNLTLDPSKHDYTGSVRIDLSVKRMTSTLAFHARDLDIRRIVLTDAEGQVGFEKKSLPGGRIELALRRPLVPGPHRLDIDFRNDFNTRAASLYRLETGGHAYAFTQFEAADARGAFPCFDEPSFKIPWKVTLTVPEGQLAVANTPVERESSKRGMRTVSFATTRPLPSYLLALAVGPFDSVPIPGLSVPGRVITVMGSSGLAGAPRPRS
jgi:alanyl aminopeptidase